VGQAALFPIRIDGPAGDSGRFVPIPAELRLLRRAVESLEDGMVITAETAPFEPLQVLYANPAFTALSAAASADSRRRRGDDAASPPSSRSDDPLWNSLEESRRSDGVFSTEIVLPQADGGRMLLRLRSEPVCDESGRATHRIAVFRNVTEQADLQEALRRNERLACVGLLAAGIAHEINNPAGAALLAAETALALMKSPDAGEQLAACLRNIVTSVDRCGRIVRTLLRYTREEPSEKQACSINDVAKQAVELVRSSFEPWSELHMELDPKAPLAPMNPLEIELVLVNLFRNAVQASDGRVTISIRTARIESGVRIAVCDNGCGMNEEQRKHVFDPLYSTRRQFGGSGLGMSIARGMIQGHKGRMEVESQPGVGTTVTIDLPVALEAS
jgi:signal transduction histidine kinase